MTTLECLQNYWWLLIAVLGALLVFLLFVQGGQTLLMCTSSEVHRSMIVNALGRRWELGFTTLVTFGGAFFASFPLFYSTSFGGAYWLWMLILFSFILQAVSYEYRSKPGNLLGTRTYDVFLFINGLVGCVLLGVAVAMFFFGAEFDVNRANLLDAAAPVISTWAPTHGFEAIFNLRNLCLGVAVFLLARTLGALYLLNSVDDAEMTAKLRRHVTVSGALFVVFFLAFVALLLTADGYETAGDGTVKAVAFKYFHNYVDMWWCAAMLLAGVVAVLYGIGRTVLDRKFTKGGIWWAGAGTVLVVLTLFFVAGYNNTAYYPSLLDPQASLTIRNSSSSQFTLTVMSCVSVIIPFVLAYIVYCWRALSKPVTPKSDFHY